MLRTGENRWRYLPVPLDQVRLRSSVGVGAVLVFTLFALINLVIGFVVAVLLGHGPQPWYALFLPARGNDVVQIDLLEAEEQSETPTAPPVAEEPPVPRTPVVSQPFPEMNEPDDLPEDPPEQAPPQTAVQEDSEDDLDRLLKADPADTPTRPAAEMDESELEQLLAPPPRDPPEQDREASTDDSDGPQQPDAPSAGTPDSQAEDDSEDDLDDLPLNQDDIAALFNS